MKNKCFAATAFAVSVLALAVTLALAGCRGGSEETLVVLDVEAAIDNSRTFDLGEIARSVEFIPLDNDVPVGEIAGWHGLQPADGGFYIADNDAVSPIQHFDTGGRFVGTIGRLGRGPGETSSIVGVSRNPGTGEMYVDGTTDIVALDPQGNEFARASGFFSWGMMWYGDRLLTLPVAPPREKEVYARDTIPFIDMFDRELNPTGKIYGPNVGPSVTMQGMSFPPAWSDNGERLLVKQGGRGDTLYQYSAGAIIPAYLLSLGAHTPPAELFAIEPSGEMTDRHRIVAAMWESERWLMVSAGNNSIFDPESTLSYLFFDRSDVAAGGFRASGPNGEQGLLLDGVQFRPGYVRGNRLVGYMQAFDIVDNAARITRPDLKDIATGLREDSNPVIVIVELGS